MPNEFDLAWTIKWDRKRDRTLVSLEIRLPLAFCNPKAWDLQAYVESCRRSLYKVAARESLEIQVWSVDVERENESTLITHHVYTRGVLPGIVPLRVARALRPPRGYAILDFFARALSKGWRVDRALKAAVESNHLQRYNGKGKRLMDPIPAHLLAIAVSNPGWRLLIGPSDEPWAYINTLTQRNYARNYVETHRFANRDQAVAMSQRHNGKGIDDRPTGDVLVTDILGTLRAAGCQAEVISVFKARAQGKKWGELAEYLTIQTNSSWDGKRVEAARGWFRRNKSKLRASALARSLEAPAEWRGRLPGAPSGWISMAWTLDLQPLPSR